MNLKPLHSLKFILLTQPNPLCHTRSAPASGSNMLLKSSLNADGYRSFTAGS